MEQRNLFTEFSQYRVQLALSRAGHERAQAENRKKSQSLQLFSSTVRSDSPRKSRSHSFLHSQTEHITMPYTSLCDAKGNPRTRSDRKNPAELGGDGGGEGPKFEEVLRSEIRGFFDAAAFGRLERSEFGAEQVCAKLIDSTEVARDAR